MRNRPILFSAPMVRAILEDRKTVTRRVVKWRVEQSEEWASRFQIRRSDDGPLSHIKKGDLRKYLAVLCPYGQPGDRLWVRETIRHVAEEPHPVSDILDRQVSVYAADGAPTPADAWPWRRPVLPSIHCPRGLSRITLEVTGVRVERLQDISEEDAKAEGAMFHDGGGIGHSGWRHDFGDVYDSARHSFFGLWRSINGEESLRSNPWCWCVEFKRAEAKSVAA